MTEQQIDLQKILQSEINKTKYAYTRTVNWDVALTAMKNACEKILELATKNILERKLTDGNVEYFAQRKQSILDTIKPGQMNDIDLLQTQVQINQRRSVFLSLHNLCVFADKHDYIEVTEWTNGEGYDVEIYRQKDRSECTFKLTYGEAATLMTLLNKLD